MTAPAVEFKAVSKRFGDFIANQAVSFSVSKGSIHGIVGENGAGKSTIMKVLYGLHPIEKGDGEILIDGTVREIRTPYDAISLGIGMVHQHFMLIPTLPVWKNVVLGTEPSFFLDQPKIVEQLAALQKSFGLALPLLAPVSDLSVGEQQQVEILKVLYKKADILILDEPTAVLIPQEVDALFERLRELNTGSGKTILLITHKLQEILRFTQAVTVMRQARVVQTVPTESLTEASLAEAIIGRPAKAPVAIHSSSLARSPETAAAAVLSVHGLTLHKRLEVRPRLSDISFTVHAGEVLGIAGISGNGQQELIEILSGIETAYGGDVRVLGRHRGEWDTYRLKQAGFGLIPADRNQDGLIGDFSVQDNLTLGHHREPRYATYCARPSARIARTAAPLLEKYDIRPRSLTQVVRSLSGGNQQKVIVARELDQPVDFLLAAYPSRGVDIGAIELIHDLFRQKKRQGTGILLISSELDELFQLSDRILVLFEGRVAGFADPKQVTPRDLGLLMTGGSMAARKTNGENP